MVTASMALAERLERIGRRLVATGKGNGVAVQLADRREILRLGDEETGRRGVNEWRGIDWHEAQAFL